ncbi:hypothetical protein HYY74_04950 [Candidatus Woesearchaeota archaeon]|nr:hypothetical protein [Candidatus Woesearchaeota archaeon]
MASNFRTVIEFFDKIGLFDVLLPFLLVFTLMFALLEKTKVFGVEKIATKDGAEEYTRKNMNAMVAFAVAFFVVASSRLVEIITKVSGNMIILLLASTFFLLLAGSFHKEEAHGYFLDKGPLRMVFMAIMFVGLLVIFLDAIKSGDKTWLEIVFDALKNFGTNEVVPSIVMVLVMLGIIYYVITPQKHPAPEKKT